LLEKLENILSVMLLLLAQRLLSNISEVILKIYFSSFNLLFFFLFSAVLDRPLVVVLNPDKVAEENIL